MKIPEQAKRVFEGIIFDVYQWQQKMFDGSEQTFEALKRPGTVTVIATHDDVVIINEEEQPGKPPFLTIPGGRQEESEEPLETAKRELREEAGMESEDWELWKVYEPAMKIDWQIYVYVARHCRRVGELALDAGEKVQTREVGFDEFIKVVRRDTFSEKELAMDIMRMQLDPDESKLEEFKKMLFG